MSTIMRGATLTQTFRLPCSLDGLVDISASWKQGAKIVLRKTIEDFTVDGNALRIKLTYLETLSFEEGVQVTAQIKLRYENEDRVITVRKPFSVEGPQDGGVF